ncbi:hypothetical protein IJI18_02665 [Candidatus Saccharibacteria bacterium]|nr:hypothetical protein [Candidatus Saccharibacteria bacterium]
MKEFWNNLKNWQKGGILAGALAVVAIGIVAVIFTMGSQIKVEIVFDEKNNIPTEEMKKIREKMLDVIRDNTENFDSTVVYRGAATDYRETSEGKTSTASFVVNFDTISESYKVSVVWPDPEDGSPNIIISCALLDGEYPKTPCTTESNSSSDILGYLPYVGEDAAGRKYEIVARYDDEKLYLEIKTDGDMDEAVTAVKDWMKKLNFNPDNYLLYIQSRQYIQVNHAKTKDVNVNKYLPYFIPAKYYIYPIVDGNSDVTSIRAELGACTEAQIEPAEELVREYLSSNGINYPIEFEYCVN